VLVLLGTVALWAAEPLYHAVWEAGGGAFAAGLLAELVVATAVVLLPSASMGATFSHLAQTASVSGFGLGRALSLNTAGAALAPGLVGVLLLPAIGSLYALVACGLGYALLCPSSERRAYLRLAVPAALAAGLVATLSPEALVPLAAGERLVRHAEGVMAAVSVVQDGRGDLHLRINGRFQVGGTSSAHSDRREAHIPLLLHPDPQRALFLGLGAGITFEAAARHPRLVADGVELVPEIVPLMRHFAPELGAPERQANLRVHVADARRYVRATRETYDVVVADLFHPARDGAGSLYTAEHFRAIRERLAPAGLFVQWLPLYQMDLETLRTVVRTFLQVYPEAGLLLAHYSLVAPIVGLAGGPAMDLPSVDPTRLQAAGLAPELRALRLDNVYEVVGTWLADARALAAFAGTGPVNTDDLPVVTYGAPRFAYARQRPPAERLLALIDTFPPDLATALGPERAASLDETTRRRLHDYLLARNAFVHAGVGVSDDMDVKGLLGAVRGPLLEVVRTSRDFGAAYGPLLAMARRLAATDTPSALRLLREVELANPWRLEAAALRRRLLASP
jgi:spermidine synthase